MDKFFVNTGLWLHRLFPNYLWKVKTDEPIVYLTFDDGPTPIITSWVLDTLKKYNAKATFFCIGNNLESNLEIVEEIFKGGHLISNHTFEHENGWKTSKENYFKSVLKTDEILESIHIKSVCKMNKFFRPPYGKIKLGQAKKLMSNGFKIVMWDVLSRDYDSKNTHERCVRDVLNHTTPGSIIVFHDSKKAFPILEKALPEILISLKNKGYRFETLA